MNVSIGDKVLFFHVFGDEDYEVEGEIEAITDRDTRAVESTDDPDAYLDVVLVESPMDDYPADFPRMFTIKLEDAIGFDEDEVTAKKMTDEAGDWISNKIRLLVREGKSQEQAAAIAYSMAKEKGYKVPEKKAGYGDQYAEDAKELVFMAKEIVDDGRGQSGSIVDEVEGMVQDSSDSEADREELWEACVRELKVQGLWDRAKPTPDGTGYKGPSNIHARKDKGAAMNKKSEYVTDLPVGGYIVSGDYDAATGPSGPRGEPYDTPGSDEMFAIDKIVDEETGEDMYDKLDPKEIARLEEEALQAMYDRNAAFEPDPDRAYDSRGDRDYSRKDSGVKERVESFLNANPNAARAKSFLSDFYMTYSADPSAYSTMADLDSYFSGNPNAERFANIIKEFWLSLGSDEDTTIAQMDREAAAGSIEDAYDSTPHVNSPQQVEDDGNYARDIYSSAKFNVVYWIDDKIGFEGYTIFDLAKRESWTYNVSDRFVYQNFKLFTNRESSTEESEVAIEDLSYSFENEEAITDELCGQFISLLKNSLWKPGKDKTIAQLDKEAATPEQMEEVEQKRQQEEKRREKEEELKQKKRVKMHSADMSIEEMDKAAMQKTAKWYIMNARGLFDGKFSSIQQIVDYESWKGREQDIAIAKVVGGSKMFVAGARGTVKPEEVGSTVQFVQDTGLGYGSRGTIEIQNLVQVNSDGSYKAVNTVGLDDKRPCWVFK